MKQGRNLFVAAPAAEAKAAADMQPGPIEYVPRELSPAMADVIAERRRQIEAEGWTLAHDDEHEAGDLAAAGSCYALSAAVILNPYTQGDGVEQSTPPYAWPWDAISWKIDLAAPRRALVKAAALVIAEIERLDRAAARQRSGRPPT